MAEIAKAFGDGAMRSIKRKEGIERLADRAKRHLIDEQCIQPRAFEITANEQRIIARHPADDANIAGIGPGAAVGATGDADAEPLMFEPVTGETRFDASDDVVAHALGLSQRQATSRQGRAGERPALGRQNVLGETHAMRTQYRGDLVPILGPDLAQDDVLTRHQDRINTEAGDHLAQDGADLRAGAVDDASARHRNAKIELPVALLMPAEMVGHRQLWQRAAGFDFLAEIFGEALARPFLAPFG